MASGSPVQPSPGSTPGGTDRVLDQVDEGEWVTALDAKVAEFFASADGKQVTITRTDTKAGKQQPVETVAASDVPDADKPSGQAIVDAMTTRGPVSYVMDDSAFAATVGDAVQSVAFSDGTFAHVDGDGNLTVVNVVS